MFVYVPTTVAVRRQSDLAETPRHLFTELYRQRRHMSDTARQVAAQSICRSAAITRNDNIVLRMLGDWQLHISHQTAQLLYKCNEVNVAVSDNTDPVSRRQLAAATSARSLVER